MDEINDKLEDPTKGSSNVWDGATQWNKMLEEEIRQTSRIPNERNVPKTRDEFNRETKDRILKAAEIGYYLSVFGKYPDWYIENQNI